MTVSWQRVQSAQVTSDVVLTLATELVVATIPGVTTDGVAQVVRLLGYMVVTTGVGATTVTLRWRRTGLTGTLVGEANAITSAASTVFSWPHEAEDTPGEVASLAYVLTATAAGVAGTANFAYAVALIGG